MNNIQKNLIKFFKKNAPTILTIVGSVGMVGTIVMAVKATPKAIQVLESKEKEKSEPLTALETIKYAGLFYIPTTIVGICTLSCIFGANVLNKKQQATLLSSYYLLKNSYKEYRNKLIDVCGEDTDKKIREEIIKNKIESDIPYICPDNGLGEEIKNQEKRLFYDSISRRYFESNFMAVLDAEYNLNRNFIMIGEQTPNDFYRFLGIPELENGDSYGWTLENGYSWIDFEHTKTVLDDGLEYYIISPYFDPDPNFMMTYVN